GLRPAYRFQHDFRSLSDLISVLLADFFALYYAFSEHATACHAHRMDSRMLCRLKLDPSVGETAVINPLGTPCTLQRLIRQSCPTLPPPQHQFRARLLTVQFPRLVAKTVRPDPPRAGQDVRMVIPLVALFLR